MRLDNLTKEQADMCDIIWNVGTYEEFKSLSKTWPEQKRQMAVTLIHIMSYEDLEIDIEKMNSFPIAEKLIQRVRNCSKNL